MRASVVRLPQVHERAKQGLITPLIEIFRANGTCAYVGDGSNFWPAAHVLDVARLYRLAIEKRATGAACGDPEWCGARGDDVVCGGRTPKGR
ncbi:hypothetical protein [Komagataeibacter oboediens]